MGRAHNKKRNIGIIFEQLVQYISTALVDKDSCQANQALRLIKKHFRPGTELYREFRLFNALVKTRVSNEGLVNRILTEAKHASKKFNSQNLRKQKSSLIKDINYTLSGKSFYLQHIHEYRSYATIQTLLNDWRSNRDVDLARVAKYEDKVCKWLLSEKTISHVENFDLADKDDINRLTIKILTEKFNKKYSSTLNEEQQDLIKRYVFSLSGSKYENFMGDLQSIKANTLTELKQYSKICENQVLNEKIAGVIKRVEDISLKEISDDLVSRFLVISKLKEELLEMSNE